MNRNEIKEKVFDLISNLRGVEVSTIHEDLILEDDLGFDSLDMIEMVMAVEGIFSIGIPDDDTIRKEMSVREWINYLETFING